MTTLKTVQPTQISSLKTSNPYTVQDVKNYVFNQTGNIMMSTTSTTSAAICQNVCDVFEEVSVFFAAMTKAMATGGYSLYDQVVMQRIIDESGLFVQVTEEQVEYSMQTASIDFSKDLLEAILGLATGTGEMAFASAMISSMGQQGLKISEGDSKSSSKVGNIVFVCEYLLGMPVVSAIVVYADYYKNSEWFSVGPCISGKAVQKSLNLTKSTYLFVVPSLIKEFAGDLANVEKDAAYKELITYLESLIDGTTPMLGALTTAGNVATDTKPVTKLYKDVPYTISGENFGKPGTHNNSLSFLGVNHSIPTGIAFKYTNWSPTSIVFEITTIPAAITDDTEVYLVVNTSIPAISSHHPKPVATDGHSTGLYKLEQGAVPEIDDIDQDTLPDE